MVGDVMLKAQDFADYLGRLLGRSVALDDVVQLTSGQQARVGGWLAERGVGDPRLRSRLSAPFRPGSITQRDGATVLQTTSQPKLVRRPDSAFDSMQLGIDIQRIDELFAGGLGLDLKSEVEVTSIFTLREISYAESRPNPLETLGGLFASKEALRKCDAELLARAPKEVEILPDSSGRPEFRGYSLSISHSGGFAVAVAAKLSMILADASHSDPSPATLPPKAPVAESSASMRGRLIRLALMAAILVCGALAQRLFGVLGHGN